MPNFPSKSAPKSRLSNPCAAGIFCSLFVLPAHPVGQEVAQGFRRLVDFIISKNDTLFEFVSKSSEAADTARTIQAWGAWIVYGLVAALIAMAITRWLAKRPLSWITITVVVFIWIGIYLTIWNWDNQLQFTLSEFNSNNSNQSYGPWPYAGSFGFFGGFVVGLVLAASPWRASTPQTILRRINF